MLPGKYYGHVVTRGANSWIRGKIEFSSYVNKASLNPVFGNFQRSLGKWILFCGFPGTELVGANLR